MNTIPTASVQNARLVIVHLEDYVSSLVPETMHIDEPILIENNHENSLAKNFTEPGKFETAPSCMDACGSGPEPSFMSIPSPDQVVNNLDSSQLDDSCHDKEEETLQQVLNRVYETKIAELKNELKSVKQTQP